MRVPLRPPPLGLAEIKGVKQTTLLAETMTSLPSSPAPSMVSGAAGARIAEQCERKVRLFFNKVRGIEKPAEFDTSSDLECECAGEGDRVEDGCAQTETQGPQRQPRRESKILTTMGSIDLRDPWLVRTISIIRIGPETAEILREFLWQIATVELGQVKRRPD